MSYYYEKKSDQQNYYFANHKTNPFGAVHFHSAREIILVKRGKMRAYINAEKYAVNGGEGCFADSFCTHGFRDMEGDTEVYVFVINSKLFEELTADMDGIPPVQFKFSDFELLDKILGYYENADKEGVRSTVFKGIAAFLLSRIADENELVYKKESTQRSDICDILAYICDHFKEDISLQSLARTFGYSPQYFSSMFHKHMNVNLTEYINIARVNYARKLLSSDKSIAEIAYESGFNSLNSFYRAYKKVYGTSPRA
jgi:AraC-like DNA-binding protein